MLLTWIRNSLADVSMLIYIYNDVSNYVSIKIQSVNDILKLNINEHNQYINDEFILDLIIAHGVSGECVYILSMNHKIWVKVWVL